MSIEHFIRYISLEKRYSPHTVTAYSNDLEDFFAYLTETYGQKEPGEINPGMVRSWMVQLMEQGMVARSINRKLTTLRSYFKYLQRQGVALQNPMLRIQPPKNAKKLPVFVESEKMRQLFSEVHFSSDFEGVRNRLLLELFYCTGMRLSELIGLRIGDLDMPQSTLKVLGKRNKERILPYPPEINDLIGSYLALRSEGVEKDNDILLLSLKRKKLNPKAVYSIVVKYLGEVTTLEKRSPHILRHTFATHMLNNGADINSIKELLGHANLSATQVYTHNTIEKLKNIHRKAHPKA